MNMEPIISRASWRMSFQFRTNSRISNFVSKFKMFLKKVCRGVSQDNTKYDEAGPIFQAESLSTGTTEQGLALRLYPNLFWFQD